VNICIEIRATVRGLKRVISAMCNRFAGAARASRPSQQRNPELETQPNEDWVDSLNTGASGGAFALDAAAGIFGAIDQPNVKHGESA
jgi:hypothetical protein